MSTTAVEREDLYQEKVWEGRAGLEKWAGFPQMGRDEGTWGWEWAV